MYHEERTTQWKQWAASITAATTTFCFGTSIGWITTTLPRLMDADSPTPMTPSQASWMVSLTPIGYITGSLVALISGDNFGRKRTLLLSGLTYITGWLMTIFATSPHEFYISRVILGAGNGISITVCPIYVSEITDSSIRGSAGTLIPLNIIAGMSFTCVVGPFVSTVDLTIILLTIPVLFLLGFLCFPDSPAYLASKGQHAEAARSLAFFRGIRRIERASAELKLVVRDMNQDLQQLTWSEKLRGLPLPLHRKSLAILMYVTLAQAFCGSAAIQMYLSVLLRRASIGMDPDAATTMVLLVSLVSCAVGMALIERTGRKPLLCISSLGMSGCMTMMGTYLLLLEHGVELEFLNWVPVVIIVLSQIFYELGLSGIPTVLFGDLLPTNVKGVARALMIVCYALYEGSVTKMYQVVGDALGDYVNFYIFGGSSLVAFFVTACFIPETKNRTVQEVQEELGRSRWMRCGRRDFDGY